MSLFVGLCVCLFDNSLCLFAYVFGCLLLCLFVRVVVRVCLCWLFVCALFCLLVSSCRVYLLVCVCLCVWFAWSFDRLFV